MIRRRPIARMAVGTAVVAGTARAVAGHTASGQAQPDSPPGPPAAQAPPTGAPAGAPDPIEQLQRLAELREQGVLTEAEFAAQKAKILG